jgi:hypothetical protein
MYSPRTIRATLAVAVCGLMLSGCGLNPFGAGQGGLRLFANIGKAVKKPSAINEEENCKDGAKTVVTEGQAMPKRLAKAQSTDGVELWLVDRAIEDNGDGSYTYWEEVINKPAEEDPDKKLTGRGEVVFKYDGVPEIGTVVEGLITDVVSFYFVGKEHKTWNFVTDSIELMVEFANTDINDIKPGRTWAWGKNISGDVTLGHGDTAYFELDSLDDVNKVQYGEGHFLDAHTGRDNTGEPYAFDFDLEVHYENTQGGNPYLRYEDNWGIVKFKVEWNDPSSDYLHFTINFYPQYDREAWIRNDAGQTLVYIVYNEKTGVGSVTYYNEDGDVIDSE